MADGLGCLDPQQPQSLTRRIFVYADDVNTVTFHNQGKLFYSNICAVLLALSSSSIQNSPE